MKTETFAEIVGEMDEKYVAAAEKRAAVVRAGRGSSDRIRRLAAIAAAAVLLFGAVFAAVKITLATDATQDQVKLWKRPAEIPEDAVLPPLRVPPGGRNVGGSYETSLGFVSAFEKADAVCLVTIENWLSENMFCSFFEASVDKVYKGELPEKIALRQEATSTNSIANTPLFTYGNKFLLFLGVWDSWDEGVQRHDNAYYMLNCGTAYLIYAQDERGNDYLIDLFGDLSFKTRKAKEADIADRYNGGLIRELIEYVSAQDEALADTVERFTHDTSRSGGYDPSDSPMTVLKLGDVHDLLTELSKAG